MALRSAGWEVAGARLLDHVIALNEQHLRRLIRDYVNDYHQDRIHADSVPATYRSSLDVYSDQLTLAQI